MPERKKTPRSLILFSKYASLAALLAVSSITTASEGEFIGLYAGTTVSNSADKTSNSFKILAGSHITRELSLEFGYMNLGKTEYSTPTALNQEATSRDPIIFKDAGHGSVSRGQLGDPTVIANGPDLYENKGVTTFNGVSEFVPEGALINFSYTFPIVNKLDFFVKTGFYAWWADYKTITATASQESVVTVTNKEQQATGVNTISGGGFIYRPMSELSIRAEVETTAIESGDMPRTRLQNISIGANWEF